MARQIPASELEAIENTVRRTPGGVPFRQIASAVPGLPRRTLQARIKKLVDAGRLVRRGERRGARYFLPGEATEKEKQAAAAYSAQSVHRFRRILTTRSAPL